MIWNYMQLKSLNLVESDLVLENYISTMDTSFDIQIIKISLIDGSSPN
jgi:hypothetical protein